MEAKIWQDTVMSNFKCYSTIFLKAKRKYILDRDRYDKHTEEAGVDAGCKAIAQAQAEISFKAGMETGNQKAYEIGVEDGKVEGIDQGIREVVEWLREENDKHPQVMDGSFIVAKMDGFRWHDKLKEWGIE